MSKFRKPSLTLVLAVLICLSLAAAGVVSADPSLLPGNKDVYLEVANDNGARFNIYNDNTYHFFSADQGTTQGLNSLHLSSSSSDFNGDVTNTTSTSGTFYLTENGTRGWDDNGILMIAVNGTDEDLADFSIQINSAGYTWTPLTDGYFPDYSATTYNSAALSETFTLSDFNDNDHGYYSYWKPAPSTNYPIFENQDMSDTTNTFKIIFVDLRAGIIGNYTLPTQTWNGQNVVDNGAIKVDYTISNLPQGSMTAFNSYAYCENAVQGQGIRWTNKVKASGASTSGTSGYFVRNY